MNTKYGFTKGLNRDISKYKFPNDAYYYLLNGRILTDDDATMSDIINLKGNSVANITITASRVSYNIIGYCTIGNDIILFYTQTSATGVDDYSSISKIDRLIYNSNDSYTQLQIWSGTGLNFRVDKKIKAIGRVEDSDITKIYWTDNNESFKYLHLENGASNVKDFDITGYTSNINSVQFSKYTSGSLKQGVIYYSYRFLKRYGSNTKYTTLSLPIPIAREVDPNDIANAKGDDVYNVETSFNAGIGISGTITIADSYVLGFYDTIEIVSLWQSSKYSIPDVTIVNRINIDSSNPTYYFSDDGTTNYGTVEYSEFLNQIADFTAKDVVTKDNRLFVGNITEHTFDVDADATWVGKSPGDEWDARSYRFDNLTLPNNNCQLRDADTTTTHTYITGPSPAYGAPVVTEDCFNIYNKITSTPADALNTFGGQQKYKVDGTTLGGSGLNISYNFYKTAKELMNISQTSPGLSKANTQDHLGFIKGFQRDEIYRFGIVFFDNKGRSSFAKWIGDIRIPKISDSGTGFTSYPVSTFSSGSGLITVNTLHVNFTIANIPTINSTALNYQIVYVPREVKDKSILYAGVASYSYNDTVNGVWRVMPHPYPTSIDHYRPGGATGIGLPLSKLQLNINSPEISFNKTETYLADFLQVAGRINSEWAVEANGDTSIAWSAIVPNNQDYNSAGFAGDILSVRKLVELTNTNVDCGILSINQQAKVSPPLSSNFIVSIFDPYTHWSHGVRNGAHGTSMVMRMANDDNGDGIGLFLTSTVTSPIDGYLYTYGRKEVYSSQYGGISYENRTLNQYISANDIIAGTTSTSGSIYGDTLISLFEYQNVIRGASGTTTDIMDVNYIVCETTINCLLRHDIPHSKTPMSYESRGAYVAESEYVDSDTGINFPALYQYNDAYSRGIDAIKYFIKPSNFKSNIDNNTMIKYSELRLDGEDSDSWLNFKTNNYHHGDAIHGSINKLVEFNNNMLSFQDSAVALIPINSKATTQSDDGVSITLGTGAVIDDFRYLTTNIGCQDNSDVIKSFSALYWLDKNKKKIYTFNGKMQSVSDIKGIHSYLKNNIYEDSYFTGAYDIKNSEVLMTVYDNVAPNSNFQAIINGGNWDLTGDTTLLDYSFIVDNVYKFSSGWFRVISITSTYIRLIYSHGTDFVPNEIIDMHPFMSERDNFTIAYNEKLQAFTSFYSFLPTLYIPHNKGFFTSITDRDLWQHNINTYHNDFYGISYPTILKIIANENAVNQSEYNNIKLFTEVKNLSNDYLRNETVTNIFASNNYQTSNDIILYPIHLPEDITRTKYVLDTSSDKLGTDWYSGLVSPFESLRVYQNELYRCSNVAGHVGPPVVGANWTIAELGNIKKTVDYWSSSLPRITTYPAGFPEDSNYPISDRLRAGWTEITLEFKDTLPSIPLHERKFKLSDIIISSEKLQF